MAPCYLWAQNHSHLLVKIKFTPKIDIPGNNNYFFFKINFNIFLKKGYLDVININVTILS